MFVLTDGYLPVKSPANPHDWTRLITPGGDGRHIGAANAGGVAYVQMPAVA